MSQSSPFFRQPINVQCFDRVITEAAQICYSKVVHKKDKNIWLCRCYADCEKQRNKGEPMMPHNLHCCTEGPQIQDGGNEKKLGSSVNSSSRNPPRGLFRPCHAFLIFPLKQKICLAVQFIMSNLVNIPRLIQNRCKVMKIWSRKLAILNKECTRWHGSTCPGIMHRFLCTNNSIPAILDSSGFSVNGLS